MLSSVVMHLLLAWLTVFAINLVPALMPPTWSVVVFFTVHESLPPLPLAIGSALASTLGRLGLALATRTLGTRFIKGDTRENLDALGIYLGRRTSRVGLAILFGSPVSPFPSNQLFLAAGLAHVDLRVAAPSFFVGRAIEYTAAALAAGHVAGDLPELFGRRLSDVPALLTELASLASLVLLAKIPWGRLLHVQSTKTPG